MKTKVITDIRGAITPFAINTLLYLFIFNFEVLVPDYHNYLMSKLIFIMWAPGILWMMTYKMSSENNLLLHMYIFIFGIVLPYQFITSRVSNLLVISLFPIYMGISSGKISRMFD